VSSGQRPLFGGEANSIGKVLVERFLEFLDEMEAGSQRIEIGSSCPTKEADN
jgi:hypothetical protein